MNQSINMEQKRLTQENDQQAEIYILWHANMFGKVQVSSGRESEQVGRWTG